MTNPVHEKAPPRLASASLRYEPGGQPKKMPGNGSGWILALAILQAIGALVFFGISASNEVSTAEQIGALIVTGGLSAVFFGLWIWGRNSPYPALCTALGLFLFVHAVDAVLDPMTLLRGILVKIVVLTGLITAIQKARRASKFDAR
ncbi:MAG: hypothetical protein C0518_04700 [Opitutus sp.]|nr:hypothetical protein [Opitutus sp.]